MLETPGHPLGRKVRGGDNQQGRRKAPSETAWRAPFGVVIQSDLYGDMQRPAETTGPRRKPG